MSCVFPDDTNDLVIRRYQICLERPGLSVPGNLVIITFETVMMIVLVVFFSIMVTVAMEMFMGV